jgi:transposase
LSDLKRPVAQINRDRQIPLFDEPPALVLSRSTLLPEPVVRFVEPDPSELRMGSLRVSEHLRQMGIKEPLQVRELLLSLDWSAFEAAYSGGGRPPYAPRLMTGIILYGLMRGVSSLRELARFARTDLGCMWVSGGIAPDYSILGRFIQRHAALFQGRFFEALTERVLKRTGSGRERLAGDGTVLEAVSSRFSLLSREATRAKATASKASASPGPGNSQAYERLTQRFDERPRSKALSPLEPDACLLHLKNRRGSRLGYEAAVLANEARVVVDVAMDPTSE